MGLAWGVGVCGRARGLARRPGAGSGKDPGAARPSSDLLCSKQNSSRSTPQRLQRVVRRDLYFCVHIAPLSLTHKDDVEVVHRLLRPAEEVRWHLAGAQRLWDEHVRCDSGHQDRDSEGDLKRNPEDGGNNGGSRTGGHRPKHPARAQQRGPHKVHELQRPRLHRECGENDPSAHGNGRRRRP
eukprot:scaffold20356_cov125-Isochrysis_galbana.AAC.9